MTTGLGGYLEDKRLLYLDGFECLLESEQPLTTYYIFLEVEK